jgi:hypothetical protein
MSKPRSPKKKASLVKIKYLLQTSDHDGYCTDEEAEYAESREHVEVEVPEKDLKSATVNALSKELQELTKFIPKPKSVKNLDSIESRVRGSKGDPDCYCDIDTESLSHGLVQHSYRLTVLEVTKM